MVLKAFSLPWPHLPGKVINRFFFYLTKRSVSEIQHRYTEKLSFRHQRPGQDGAGKLLNRGSDPAPSWANSLHQLGGLPFTFTLPSPTGLHPHQQSTYPQGRSVVSSPFETPWTAAHQAPWTRSFPGENTGVGCHSLHQGIFPIQGWSRCPLPWQVGCSAIREAPSLTCGDGDN